ncbi:sulfate adenylyltransferase subunit 1 [Yinghuangia seranimata]|uniref:sulfate adenylyltransferase subunit 1 n=1 Tax=Yinghuangia seranimata TaxID=408067 RepID=UPI00248B828B|nr:GTP-binding protein [Yinghuangia seranimata]MDI2129661.1 GTP-binding protein [Yinghuangia seranimata]
MLRIATAGSVDDGKSTLIGRLLYDAKTVQDDQLAAITDASRRRGDAHTDLSLLTDGLRAEREQGITIDVAYRYFATPRRTFIVADTPGHEQYTRNMVTGASTADVAMVLVDARKGVREQSRRHAFLAALLGIPHIVVCVNKMDLVDHDERVFASIAEDFAAFAAPLGLTTLAFVPISALNGDNVVTPGTARMPWYTGPPLLGLLEDMPEADAEPRDPVGARLPVQYVIRPQGGEHRYYAGSMAGGGLRPGDAVTVLPSGRTSRVLALTGPDGPVEYAYPPMPVTVTLADQLDVSRGDLICRTGDEPPTARDLEATVCWMSEHGRLRAGATYLLKHTTRTVRARVTDVRHRLDVNTLATDPRADELALNDIGRVALRVGAPLPHDPYRRNRATGAFILIDEATDNTVAAGIILDMDTETADRGPDDHHHGREHT